MTPPCSVESIQSGLNKVFRTLSGNAKISEENVRDAVREVRGLGLMIGIECASSEHSLSAVQQLLARGYVLLPGGADGRVLSLTPPLVIGEEALFTACDAIAACLGGIEDDRGAAA